MKRNEAGELIVGFFDGSLSETGQKRLDRLVREDESAAQVVAEEVVLEGMLRAYFGREERSIAASSRGRGVRRVLCRDTAGKGETEDE